MINITGYCDGGCRNNQSKKNLGAWAYFIIGEKENFIGGNIENNTTNNQMEIKACIELLKKVKQEFPEEIINITIHSDSNYLVSGINIWINNWISNNWCNAKNHPVKNQELWKELLQLKEDFFCISVVKCKGHSGEQDGNHIVDTWLNKLMDGTL